MRLNGDELSWLRGCVKASPAVSIDPAALLLLRSFPRKRESRKNWVPAFAGTNGMLETIMGMTPAPRAAARPRRVASRLRDGRPHAREAVARLARRRGCEKSPRQQTREVERRSRAQAVERRDEPLLDRGEVAAEGKGRQQALVARSPERARDARGRVVAAGGGELEALLDLASIARAPQQFILETRIGDREHRRDHVAVALAAQIGDAVFRHHDVAQMARDRGVAVVR